MANRRSASGDCAAASLSRMSSVPLASTGRPGRNLSVAGLGVGSVWINMAGSFARATTARGKRVFGHTNRWRRAAEVQDKQVSRSARPAAALRHRIKLLIAEVSGNDGDRYREVIRIFADAGAERTGSVFPRGGGQHQN